MQAASPSQVAQLRTLGGPPMVSSRPSRSESLEQPDPSVPVPVEPRPASLGYPVCVSLRDGSPMVEKLACLMTNRGHAHAPPATAMSDGT